MKLNLKKLFPMFILCLAPFTMSHVSAGKHKPRVRFTKGEDQQIVAYVQQNGPKKWEQLARTMPGRTGRLVRERWVNYLSPEIFKQPWSSEEDQLLISKHSELGNRWSIIAKDFPGRTDINLKNRYNKLLRQNKKKMENNLNSQASPVQSPINVNFVPSPINVDPPIPAPLPVPRLYTLLIALL